MSSEQKIVETRWANGQLRTQKIFTEEGKCIEYKEWWSITGNMYAHRVLRNGKREGKNEEFHADGQISIRSFYRNGNLDGEYKTWYKNGQCAELTSYRNGRLEGKYKEWHKNGQLWKQEFYNDGELEGEYRLWCSDGELWIHGYTCNGDLWYPKNTKLTFLRAKRYFRKHNLQLLDTMLISDLTKII